MRSSNVSLPLRAGRGMPAVSSKVVLNVHQDDRSALESHRINNMLALGKCIVSERSVDPALDAEYERDGAVVFVDDLGEIFHIVRDLLLDERLLQYTSTIQKHKRKFSMR
jgi:hypothetical protein